MKLFNWSNIRLLLIIVAMVGLYSFSEFKNSQRKLVTTEVIFENQNSLFIKPETVNKLLIENRTDVKSIAKDELNLEKLEKNINKHPMVSKSEVFVTVDGMLKAKIKQKKPLARFFGQEGSYYIDENGRWMPLSTVFTARVPIIQGNIETLSHEKMAEVLKAIDNDTILRENITGITIDKNGFLKMKNRNFDYSIDFGKPISVQRKFNNYKAFLQKTVSDKVSAEYKKVSLVFTTQVVCTK